MKIIICGGHLTPAVAVISELGSRNQESGERNKILFIGRKYPLEGEPTVSEEYKIITQMGIPFVSLTTGRLQRKFTRYTIPSLLKIPIGFLQALWQVAKFRPDIILSFGGYVALPVVVVGWLLRVPIVTHEQTAVSGLANKIIGWFARKICVSWSESVGHFPEDKVVLTGNPVRREIFEINKNSQFAPPAGGRNSQFPLIYITGGSLGSHAINEAVAECLPQLLEKYVIIHQCGDSEKYRDWENLKVKPFNFTQGVSGELKVDLQKRYLLTKYVDSENIGWVLNRADLVVGRAGANTVTELAVLGKPALFIPLPWSHQDEQTQNAQLLARAGTAAILPQNQLWGEKLLDQINKMFAEIENFKKNSPRAKKLVPPHAAAKIVVVIDTIYAEKRRSQN